MLHGEGADDGIWEWSMNGEGHGFTAGDEGRWDGLFSGEWSLIAVVLTAVGYVV
jgi:hypothetical protein